VELVCYVMTRDNDEFATVREELLLKIMAFVEDSGTNLASPSQTLYLNPDPASTKGTRGDADQTADVHGEAPSHSSAVAGQNVESNRVPGDRARLESALHNRPQDDGKNARKDD
jgi:hypothetical protein